MPLVVTRRSCATVTRSGGWRRPCWRSRAGSDRRGDGAVRQGARDTPRRERARGRHRLPRRRARRGGGRRGRCPRGRERGGGAGGRPRRPRDEGRGRATRRRATSRDAIGTTPVLSVASELRFEPVGVLPVTGGDLAGRACPGRAGRPCPRRAALARGLDARRRTRRPTRTRSSAATTRTRRRLALELAERLVSGRALDAGPLASARALEGMTAVIVNLNKRYRGHAGIRVTGLP